MNTLNKLQALLAGEVTVYGEEGSEYGIKAITERIICADGTKLSVQASNTHHSTPRSNYGPYSHVEVWRVTSAVTEFKYTEDDPSAYVPIEQVVQFIDNHGGFKE
jgi:hypothetical protein